MSSSEPSSAAPCVLVIADAPRAVELAGALSEPLPTAVVSKIEVLSSSGGDEAVDLFEARRPHVVVVTATLETGDTGALLEAVRGMVPRGGVGVVVVGDAEGGSIRVAADAKDLAPDRFVSRPMAPRTLRFAVASALEAVIIARASAPMPKRRRPAPRAVPPPVPPPPAELPPVPPPPPLDGPTRDAMRARWAAMADSMEDESDDAAGAGARVAAGPGLGADDKAAMRRRWEELADSMADELGDEDAGASEEAVPLPIELDARPSPADASASEEAAPLPPPIELDARRTPADGDALPQAWSPGTTSQLEDSPWSEAAATPREPTLIIRDPSEMAPLAPAAALAMAPLGEPPPQMVPLGVLLEHDLARASAEPAGPDLGGTTAEAVSESGRIASAASTADSSREGVPEAGDVRERGSGPIISYEAVPASVHERGTEPIRREGVPEARVRERGSGPIRRGGVPSPIAASGDRSSGPIARLPGVTPARGVRADAAVRGAGGRSDPDALGRPPVRAGFDLPPLDDLDADLILGGSRGPEPRFEVLDDLPDATPSAPTSSPGDGGDFARQLRAKMSQMAQRLFQGADAPAPDPADLAPSHDHSTEFDLASIGVEPPLVGVTEVEARATARATLGPELVTSPGSWDSQVRERGLPDQGEIVRGVSDAAMLLAKMFAGGSTGRITFRRGDVGTVVFFDQGRPVFASSSETRDRMGQLLVREGKITAAQYERCQSVVAESGRRMGEILVDLGYLKRRELLPAVRRHVEDIVYALFGWDRGQYQISIEAQPCAERIRLSRHPAALILEGIRRKLNRTTLERLVGPPSTVLDVGDRERLGGIINMGDLSAEERAALTSFDGQTDLSMSARAAGVDVADVLPLAWGLCVLGLATARRTDTEIPDESMALVGETDLAIDRARVSARWELVSEADYFALLGVRRDATAFEIRRAYQAARRDFAAEGFPIALRRELAKELDDIANVLDEAYRVLRDDRLRVTYLAALVE